MAIFKEYSEYYDLLYEDKDYKRETDYLDCLVRRYSCRDTKSLLDIGCGTGRHDVWFADKGYRVAGIDRSPEMIKIAKTKVAPGTYSVKFHVSDAAHFDLNRKFDAAVALFHVMSYQITNSAFSGVLKNIYRHLRKDGLFIFDFWYGPAVLNQRPISKTKTVKGGERIIKRQTMSRVNVNTDTVDVYFKIDIWSGRGRCCKRIAEHHVMRYFFLPELYLMLEIAGFEIIKSLEWMSLKKDLSDNSWSGAIVAKKAGRAY